MGTKGSASMVVPCNIYNSSQYAGLSADCTHRNLTSVPSNLPSGIVFLDISDNKLEVLDNFAFKTLPKLRHLIAVDNNLKYLKMKTFHGCASLETLNIASNSLEYNISTFPTGVFEPLINLTTLHLEENIDTPFGSYPEGLFKPLHNLENLYIDIFAHTVFDEQFGFLYNLQFLKLFCQHANLFNKTFTAFNRSKLEFLYLDSCSLTDIELDTFKPLISLRHLKIEGRPLGIRKAFLSLHGLQHRSMETIHFHRVLVAIFSLAKERLESTMLDSQAIKYLRNICVKQLIVVDCNIVVIDVPSLRGTIFSKCIEHIDMHKNNVQTYDLSYIFTVFSFVRLRFLDISFIHNGKRRSVLKASTTSVIDAGISIFKFRRTSNWPITLPHNISLINICGVTANFAKIVKPDLKFVNGEALKVINMSLIGLTYVGAKITGLENLDTLDFSYNPDLNIEPSFLDVCPNIRKLYLGGKSLKQNYLMENGTRLFQNLKHLTELDISHNDLSILPKDLFKKNSNIKVINLAGNKFQICSINTKDTPQLSILDLSDNSLSFLGDTTMAELDKMVEPDSNKSFSLMLKNNFMFCGCSSQRFILWLFETPVQLDNGGNYKCISQNGSITTTGDIYNRFEGEWRSCVSHFWLSLAVIGLIMQAGTVLFIILVIKFKSRIICFFQRVFGAPLRLPQRRDFQYDAFIGYSQSGMHFVCLNMVRNLEQVRNLTLYLRDREIPPGEDMVDGILFGINKSWKTVYVLTPNVDEDQWMTFAVKAGVYNVTDLRIDRVLVLVHSEYDQQIPDPILRVIDEDCIFRYSPQTTDRDPVWNNLYDAIVGRQH
ncbi:toll-like receptor 4 [Gigantopelta aegis]|uniref:toll-like receptor 4 n=1 Tax=Gigantopelta aegis TaxID=1735272 RepID=UPI001B888F12|nr:toll-like receptor 4 [Gigantopelta aegis]